MNFTVTLTGELPLLMSSDNGLNPRNEMAKQVRALYTKGKKRTAEDDEELARLEYRLKLYYDPTIGLYIPGENIETCLFQASKQQRKGQDFKRAVTAIDACCPLKHSGPTTPEGLWADPAYRLEKGMPARAGRLWLVIPSFPDWQVTCEFMVDDELVDEEMFREALRFAGKYVGLGAERPRYGSFTAVATRLDEGSLLAEGSERYGTEKRGNGSAREAIRR